MAASRPFLLSPPLTLSTHRRLHLHLRFLSFSAAATLSKPINQKPKTKTLSSKNPKISPLADHLKRRTRSGAALDRELYRRHADPAGGHVPVLLGEVLAAFRLPNLRSFVDCTLGAAGHSSAIIEAHSEMELYVGLDIDPVAHEKGKARIEALIKDSERLRAYTHLRNFKYIKSVLGGIDDNLLVDGVDGILMDLGMSSMQVNRAERGFSVLGDGPLDMRMDPQAGLTAEDILNSWPEEEVGRILRDYGEESNWRLLQRKILSARGSGGLHSTGELLNVIRSTSSRSAGRQGWIKTASRVFQALRIAVNDELQNLEDALYACFDSLSSGGRLAVISFHSLEDRIVKQTFLDIIGKKEEDEDHESCTAQKKEEVASEVEAWSKQRVQGRHGIVLTKRPITPSSEEERLNRRCRSAKLRVVQKA